MKYGKNYCEEKEISTSELSEAQKTLYCIAENMKMDKSISEEGYRHFQMAIKALNQEPCKDAVSRARVLSMAIYHQYNTKQASSISKDDVIKNWDDMIDFIENLPNYKDDVIKKTLSTVIPVKEKGQWIFDPLGGDWICTMCANHSMEHRNYCPNCGAEMKGEKE